MRYAQLVMGPAGSGKSTFCSTMVKHAEACRRNVQVINLDPAAEHFDYPVVGDVRELINLDDVMEDGDLRFGPNGGLVFCMEYLSQNLDWLEDLLGDDEDDYIIFDCPGQIELYTHIPVMRQLTDCLQRINFHVCGVFLIDANFLVDAAKYFSGVMSALSAMVQLEIPHVNVMTKMDLLSKKALKGAERYLDPEASSLLDELSSGMHPKYRKLHSVIAGMIDDYGLVSFRPLDITDEESIGDVLAQIDNAIQYGEDLEPREVKEFADDEEGAEFGFGDF